MTQTEFADRIVGMQDTLYRVSTTLLPQLCDREDAVQETIEKAWRKQHRLRDDRALYAWVIRILINECYALLRKRKREQPSDVLPDIEAVPNAASTLQPLLTALDVKYRLPLVLHYVEGYSVAEIAHMMRMPQGTLKSRLYRGRQLLRDILNTEEAQG